MNLEELKARLGFGEDLTLEFKENASAKESIGATASAFLNTRGGCLVAGIDDCGKIVGIPNAKEERNRLDEYLRDTLNPASLVAVEVYPIKEDGVDLLLIDVPEGKDKPFSFKDIFYLRRSSKTVKADASAIRDMVLSSANTAERWERRKSIYLSEADLDENEIKNRMKFIQMQSPEVLAASDDMEAKLNRLSLLRYGQLTNAGDLLFSRTPSLRIPQARVRATCFENEASDHFQANRIIEGPLVSVFEQCLRFILENIRKRSRFESNKPDRTDEYVYPVDAIREGLVNAFVHRDYADYGGGMTISIYPDRLEIHNSGAFPEGITPKNISTGHFIKLRNPDIANVFYLLGFMERIGRGGRMIVRECENAGLLRPTWTSSTNGVTLSLRLAKRDSFQLDKHQVVILRKCRKESSIVDLMEAVGRSDRTKFRHQVLSPLLEQGLVEMTVPDKPQSSKQRYRLSALGYNALERIEND